MALAAGVEATVSVAATLSLEEAARRTWPALVVGAGPAGAVAAAELARRGVEVLLVDRATFPRGKVCGSCLNVRALTALAEAGLGDVPGKIGAVPLEAFQIGAGGRAARLALPGGVAVSREALDAELVRAAIQRGVQFLPGVQASLGSASEQGREVLLTRHLASGGREPPVVCARTGGSRPPLAFANVVLAADGLGGALLPRSGIASTTADGSRLGAGLLLDTDEPFYRRGTIYMTCGPTGYVGLARVEDDRLDVACAVDPHAVRAAGGVGAVVARLLTDVPWPLPSDLLEANWRGTPLLTRHTHQVAAHRLFALGDATGYVEPFTGEGMAWAIVSAVAVAELAARPWHPELIALWKQRHRQLITRRQRACRVAARVLRRPALASAVVALLSYFPSLAAPVVRLLNHR